MCTWIRFHSFSVESVSPVLCLVAQLCLSPPGSSVHGDSPGKNTGVNCHALLQGTFPTQGLNPGLPRCRQILYHLSHQGSPALKTNPEYPGRPNSLCYSVPPLIIEYTVFCDLREITELFFCPPSYLLPSFSFFFWWGEWRWGQLTEWWYKDGAILRHFQILFLLVSEAKKQPCFCLKSVG